MEPLRKPFQGVWNIIRFNRQFYLLTALLVAALSLSIRYLGYPLQTLIFYLLCLITVLTLMSLLVSLYIYDLSDLYTLNWLDSLDINRAATVVNINAGFDESSSLLQLKYPSASLIVFDFYDPLKHTEISIKRARKAYPAFSGTIKIKTSAIPLPDRYADVVFLIFAAHEIRNKAERNLFFKELNRVLKPGGKVVLLEHLRDVSNFMAYNLGFFHFMSKRSWLDSFHNAGFRNTDEVKLNRFISNFILNKDGDTN